MGRMTVLPRADGEWTVEDLVHLPDDGLQYELLDGMLLVTPAPALLHQRVVARLHLLLASACPAGLEVFFAPVDWRPDRRTSLQPDLLVVRGEDVEAQSLAAPLVLAVEVLSPSTGRKDELLKRAKYEEAGVPSYWIVDPAEPSLHALDLVEGRYATAVRAGGDEVARLRRPFPMDVVPAALVSPPGA